MRHFSHLNTAIQLIEQYKGEQPFSIFIKSFFAQEKKYGSTDRKRISHLCYCYFRLGHALKSASVEEKILTGLYLCNSQPDDLLRHLLPEWDPQLPVDQKIKNISFPLHDVFPFKNLSEGIGHEAFCKSFLIQPDLFLRLRPGHESKVKQKLTNYETITPTCISLPNASKIDSLIELDKEAVVQDMNSQNTGAFFKSEILNLKSEIHLWDCCAASGGKSILAYDLLNNIQLTVSDIRESIIRNLKTRFAKAGIKNYNAFVIDLTTNHKLKTTNQYDLIICDAPCSGSGTWSRTPEQLSFFKSADNYASLQKKIVSNVIPHLKKGGRFVYITCSVFKQENEETVEFILDKFPLQLERMELLKGYDKKADTLFAASFT